MAPVTRLAFALTLTVSAATVAFAQLEDRVVPSDRVVSFVFVRAQPDRTSAELGRLHVGESVPLKASVPKWYEVELSDGTTGFVNKAWTRVSQGLAARQEDELRIHFLNVGAGNCAVVECPGPGARSIIVDCGTLNDGATADDMSEADVVTYVQNILSTTTDRPHVVISHAHQDHYRFIPTALASTQAENIWQGGDPAGYTLNGFPEWIEQQEMGGATLHANQAAHFHNDGNPLGDQLSCGLADTFVLTVNTGQSANARSLMLLIEYREFTAILAGDAEGVTQAQAVTNFTNDLKANVLGASHHGSNSNQSNNADWITAVAPDVVVFSAGTLFGHPRCLTVNRFNNVRETFAHDVRCGASNTQFEPPTRTRRAQYMTAMSGAIVITSNGQSPFRVHCTRTAECGATVPH